MAASVQCRPQERTLGMVMNEVDKDLALFLEMRRREKERDDLLHTEKLDEFDDSTGAEIRSDSSQMSNTMSTMVADKPPSDNCLNPENNESVYDKNDYDWLLTPPDTSLCSFLEVETPKSFEGTGVSTAQPAASKSTATNSLDESASLGNKSRHPATCTSIQTAAAGNRRPSSSGSKRSTSSRPATPTGRPSLPAMAKPMRPSTATSRATLPSTKTVAPPVRSSTPTRATARSSTPTARSSAPTTSKSTSRSATPTHKSSNPSLAAPSGQPSSGVKTGPITLKNPVTSRGTSPTVKSRPLKPSETPGLSHDAPNLKTSMTKRPSSASRVRPNAPIVRSSSIDTSSKAKPRQQSCSPSRGRASNGSTRSSGSAILSRSLGHSSGSDDVNPVLIGTKMVERVVNMRKLAPPKQDNHLPNENSSRKSSLSQENSGFGRLLSKKSLDMAIRHMDITRSMIDDQRPLATSAPASSLKVRSGSSKSKTVSAVDSSFVRSRTASSEPSVNGNSHSLNVKKFDNDDTDSERGQSTSTSQQHRK